MRFTRSFRALLPDSERRTAPRRDAQRRPIVSSGGGLARETVAQQAVGVRMMDVTPPDPVDSVSVGPTPGLTAADVAERVATGEVNRVSQTTSRSTWDIVRTNTLTPFNALIGSLFVVVLVAGDWRDSLFGLVIVINTGIGIVQEMRAKRSLDRLAVLGETRPTVRRDGDVVEIPAEEVVRDDLVLVKSGDEIVVDGCVVTANSLEVDESLLTGEADPVPKGVGDNLLSGSFVVEGEGSFVATRVGAQAYAATLSSEAKRFTLARSELRDGINRILKVMAALAVPVGALLV